MKIKWLGHASFFIETSTGVKIVTDPYDGVGLKFPNVAADIVTVSHDHFDHGATKFVKGKFTVVNKPGAQTVSGVKITGVSAFHDERGGKDRGANIMFVIEADDVRLCHAGDLGHQLNPQQIDSLGRVDVLLLPVGGAFTLDAAGATKLIQTIKPRIAIPMHYRIPGLSLNVSDASAFTAGKQVKKADEIAVDAASLPPPTQVVVLAPKHG